MSTIIKICAGVVACILVIVFMIMAGQGIAESIRVGVQNHNSFVNDAQICETEEQFMQAYNDNVVRHAFCVVNISTNVPVTHPDINGEYIEIERKREVEEYTKERKDEDGNVTRRASWDWVTKDRDSWSTQTLTINGVEIGRRAVNGLHSQAADLKQTSWSVFGFTVMSDSRYIEKGTRDWGVHERISYNVTPMNQRGTAYVKIGNHSIAPAEGNTISLRRESSAAQLQQTSYQSASANTTWFWIGWSVLIALILAGIIIVVLRIL